MKRNSLSLTWFMATLRIVQCVCTGFFSKTARKPGTIVADLDWFERSWVKGTAPKSPKECLINLQSTFSLRFHLDRAHQYQIPTVVVISGQGERGKPMEGPSARVPGKMSLIDKRPKREASPWGRKLNKTKRKGRFRSSRITVWSLWLRRTGKLSGLGR